MTLVDYKTFNTHVVSPHEALLALQPDIFEWDSKIITDYNILLNKFETVKDTQEDILEHEYAADEQALMLVEQKHRELVPIFSSQVIERYEKFSYKGLEVDLMVDPMNEDGTKKFVPIEKGLTGIASNYEGEKN
jgi:hypothetical protein